MNKLVLVIGILLITAGLASVTYSKLPEINQEIRNTVTSQFRTSMLPPEQKMLFTLEGTEDTRYVVELTNPMGTASIQQESFMSNIQTIGVTINERFIYTVNAVVVTASPSEITSIASMNDVKRIYSDVKLRTTIADAGDGIGTSSNSDLRDIGYDGDGVMVFVIDTGIDGSIPQLQRDGKSVVKVTYSTYDVDYTHWHGTFAASLIASQDPDLGMGVASGCDLGSVCVFDYNGEAYLSDVLDGIDFVAGWHRSHSQFCVASCSWGVSPLSGWNVGTWRNPDIISESVNSLSSQGVPVVVAAGNDGVARSINSPAVAEHVLAVGAVDGSLQIASFSSRGPTNDGHSKPDVVSYGVNIQGAVPEGDTRISSGTSFSTPLVSGIVADLAQRYGNDYTADRYYQSIRQSAIDLGPTGWDASYGNGMVNGTDAFNAMAEMTPRVTYLNAGIGLILIGSVITVSPFVRRK